MNLLIKNGLVLTVNSKNEVLKNSNIAITDDFITAFGDVPENFDADKIIDATDHFVLPGLVNTHTHIPMTLFRNYADDLSFWDWLMKKIKPEEDYLSSEHVFWGAKLGVLELIKSGVTCFSDMYFFMNEVAKVSDESGIRACISGILLDVEGLGNEFMKDAIDFIDNWHGKAEGRIKTIFGPHSIYLCGPEYLQETAEEAVKRNSIIHIHLSETRKEIEESVAKFGKTPVKHLADLGIFECKTAAAHCIHVPKEDIEILQNYKVNVLNNPTSNLKLGNGFAPINEFLERGLNVALGTDGPASNNNVNLFEEMHIASIVNKGINEDAELLTAETVLRMATINGAKALGLDNQIGSIEIGKKADLILLDHRKPQYYPRHNPVSSLVYSAQAADIRTVMVNGRILMEDYEVKTIDLEETILNVEKMASDLIKRTQN